MSAIDELKNGINIDATNESEDNVSVELGNSGGVVIDSTDDNFEDRVDLSASIKQQTKPKTKVMPKNSASNTQPIPNNTAARQTVEISAIAEDEEEDENIHESLEKDILDVDDPNSMFRQYVDAEEAEAREWLAANAEKKALEEAEKEEELDDEDEVNETSGSLVTSFKSDSDGNIEEDLSSYSIEEEDVSALESAPKKELKKIENKYSVDMDVDVTSGNVSFVEEIADEDDAEIEDDNEATLKHLKQLATEKLKPISKKLDLSSFTIAKKPVTNISNLYEETKARIAKWVLPNQNSILLMKEYSGAELEKLRQYSQTAARSLDALSRRFHLIYDHIASPKPANFEQWLKSTPYDDVDHYFFGIYMASFKGANYLPTDCINPNCKETFLSDDIDIMDMVKFETEEAKNKFLELYNSEATPAGKGIYITEVVPISDKVAISFRSPSIYNIFEIRSLSQQAQEKFSEIIDYIPYIDTIYAIDISSKTLVPITYKMFADNAQKTVRSKLQKYTNVLNTLSVDEFGVIKAYITELAENKIGMHYVYPSIDCPKCQTPTEEQEARAEDLVFTRYQLGALTTTSLN